MGRSVNPQTAPRLSADGRWVAFAAPDSNLVTNDNNRDYDIFIRDAASNAVDLVSVRAAGLPSASPNGLSELSQFSVDNDGTHFAFASEGANLVPNDTNGCRDIFVRNLVTGATTLATVSTNGINSANRMSSGPAMSAGGGYVAFSSYATDLVPGDANLASDVFVRNLQSGTTLLVSVATNGTSSGNQGSSRPAISSDGRYVLFRSKATTLASGPYTANSENLFLRDLQLGVTRALTVGG
jgi:Tol biopolymer transport system component